MPDITFAIPFYRNRDYLERAIRSVFAQTTPDWSLFISDDAGPEGDLSSWIASLPHQDKIRYVRQPQNLGIAGNWNACLRSATSDLVTLLHADDELEPDYAATMLDAARRHPSASVLFCGATVIDENGKSAFSFPDWFKRWLLPARKGEFVVQGEEGLRAVYRGNFIMCPTMCYRREHLPVTPFDGRWKQVLDLDFITHMLAGGREFVGLPNKCYRYRRHAENQTKLQSDSLLRFEEERDLYRETAHYAQDRGWLRAAAVARRMAIIKLNLAYCIAGDLCTLRLANAAKKAGFLLRLFNRNAG
jgi:glycosyltransferase involved in cell wall biosynthesis